MKRKLTKSKAPLSSRKKAQAQGNGQEDSELNARVKEDGAEVTKTSVSPKSKCYRKKHQVGKRTRSLAASSSNDDQSQASAFDYNSEDDISVRNREVPLGIKRKRGSSKDEELTSLATSRYKKSQQALNLIKKSDDREKKNVKKRKGRKAQSSTSSDEEDFNQPVKKSMRLLVPDIELTKLTSTATQGKSKKAVLNLKKNKRNAGTDDQHSEESNIDTSGNELVTVDQKNSKSVDSQDDGDDERDDDDDDGHKKDDIQSAEHHHKSVTRLENESEQTIKQNTAKKPSEIKCPVCNKVFNELLEQDKINEHVNSCLDGKGTSTNGTEIPENNPKSSLSILQDQLIAFEYQRKEAQGCDDGFSGEDGLYFCQICHKDLSKMNSQRRMQHINKCCDQMEKLTEDERVPDTRKNDVKKNILTCPFCAQEFKSRKSWQPHIKKCSQENNVPANQLLEIVKQQDQHQQEMESTSRQTDEGAENRPNEDGKKKTGQARKKRKVGQDLRKVDEETQLAMALSASMAPPPPPGNNDRKPKRKRKKDNEVIPALLLRSKEETNNVIAARAAQVVCNKDDDSDEESISCTPALAPSSLAEQFLKVEQSNAKVVKVGKSKCQVTEETVALTENSNEDKEDQAVEEASTPDTSKPVSGDTTIVLLSDMMASPDMCRSFLSFLDVDDEEVTTTEINKESNEQPATCVMVRRSAPLWSMASLDNTEPSINDFYVPGLLPVTSPKQPKKTPRKSSSTIQRKVSVREETQERLAQHAAKKSEDICEDNEEGKSDKSNKTMSESELTTASQAANLDILLELAGDDDDDDDDDEPQEPTRKSSADPDDDDDDEVFPSSGFCLPVGPNNQKDKADHSVLSLSVFLQDMSKMVGNKMLSDVMILTKGNENIPAHSFMLAARSQVLANMISEAHVDFDGQQSTVKPVHLSFSDAETDAVRCILQYIYTASVNVPQSCIEETIGLANRLELHELVKACQDSRTIHEEQQEKNGSEDQEEDVIRCSLSAEELLNAIWQDETGNVEAKENNQEQCQEEWNEGFDDDDIEEVRIFQTQAVHKRTCSEDTLQEPLEGIINLDDKNEDMETESVDCVSIEAANSDDKVLVMEVDDGINGRGQTEQNEEGKEEKTATRATETLDEEVIHVKTAAMGSCLEGEENENWEAKELGDEKEDIVYSYGKDGCDSNRHEQERDLRKRENYGNEKRDSFYEDATKLQSDGSDKLKEKKKSPMSDIQMSCDVDDDNESGHDNIMGHQSVSSKVDLTEDDDDDQDNDDGLGGDETDNGPGHENDTNQNSLKGKFDLTEDDDDEHDDDGEDDDDDENQGSDHDNVMNDQNSIKGKVDLTEDDDDEHDDNGQDDDDDEDQRSDHDNDMNDHNVKGKVDLTEDDDDEHDDDVQDDDDDNQGSNHDNDMNDHNVKGKVDLTEDDDDEHVDDRREAVRVTDRSVGRFEGDRYKSIDEESDEHDKYESIEEESEEEYGGGDNATLNQSITLLSDDNDCESPERVPENDLVIPETPHPKKRQRSPEDHQNYNQSSRSIDHPSNTSVSHSPQPEYFSCSLSIEDDEVYEDEDEKSRGNEVENDNEKDHVSEDEEAFLEKLKSRIHAKNKNTEKERKKRKGKEKQSAKNRSRNKRGTNVDIPVELGCSSVSNRSQSSCSFRVAKSSSDTRVVDLSMDKEFEEVALEENTSGREKYGSNKDEEESCSSLSPPRMLSPRVPSPCYSDFDHDVSSPPVSPVNADIAAVDVNHSPEATPFVPRLSIELQGERSRSPMDLQTDEGTRERQGSRESPCLSFNIQQEAIDSDQESEISEVVALLPVSTTDNGGTNDDGENKINEIEEDKEQNRTRCKTSTGAVSTINTKTSLFKRLGAAKYGLESTETEASSDVESIVSGLDDTPSERLVNSQPTTTSPPVPDQNDFYDDGGFNCDVDDFGACLDGDDSFMAHAAEQIELIEKQVETVIQEKPDYQVPLGKPCTPAQSKRSASRTPRNNGAQDTSVDSPITPMPNYDDMDTPDLKNEVNKFGVRALPKKKMKAKLIEIYHYTHPGAAAQTQPEDNTKEKTSNNTKGPSLKQAKAPPRTAKPASKTFLSSSQPTRQAVKKKKIPASQIRETSDSDDDGCSSVRPASQRPTAFKPSSHSTNKNSRGMFSCNIEDGSSSSSYSSQPVPSSRFLKENKIESASSLSDEDKGTGRGSNESNEDEDEFGEVSILIDKETDTASQQVNSDNLENQLLSFIESTPDIYLKVLSYQPIDLMALHELIKSSGIKCRLGQLVDFLDTQCITFTTAGQKPQRQRRKPARKKR